MSGQCRDRSERYPQIILRRTILLSSFDRGGSRNRHDSSCAAMREACRTDIWNKLAGDSFG
jgi:hypothetical protein